MDEFYKVWQYAYNIIDDDTYTPSDFLNALINANKIGMLNDNQVENYLKYFYQNNTDSHEYRLDLILVRIKQLLRNDDFELSPDYLFKIHQFLFKDLEDNAGVLRNKCISKKEKCLDLGTVCYSTPSLIRSNLEYSFLQESKKDYHNMSSFEITKNMTRFISNIWSCHPFFDGNTRTIIIFLQKYLKHLGIEFDEDYFFQNFGYFRNALVRNNNTTVIGLEINNQYLNNFFEGLFNNNSIILNKKDTYISRKLF